MKKLLFMLGCLFIFTGCTLGEDMMNTPTKRVEQFLSKYQSLDSEVLQDLDEIVKEDVNFNTNQRDRYTEIFKKHYQNLKYDIKDETIDGNRAIVEVEIEVTDHSRTLASAEAYMNANPNEFVDESGNYSPSKFVDYQLNQLEKATEKIKYTLSLSLTQNDDKWELEPLTAIQEQKINGTYVY